ncbi:MAG TPA: methylenetetrahydrofolate reductase [NAD(P)H] [Phycisphaerales bacterium]|nr:methylenetetrahydrofolate reductase [NAD(P)H] [Phycisphaerales bacterium]HIB01181.1 methylenetetrahydrofolate reductase [NAD(P)H] [Phycisphaerales bacterium]HIB51407.1 methylenetetrahydrofolate reductase [NAD(P)H] [Phycisphaerales bacterium]HIN83294.1 methylenetetrahydrofolate reductase [NAD(P)H] [Phycisphaerales bacterium]HIO19531.1 methylenetetrahydrofolate reductase [NAD(P)H] [Phycisphaerales bacterium]
MHMRKILERDKTVFGFEFFPPRTDREWDALTDRMQTFEALEPSIVSVTYGAGGSTRTKTHALVCHIAENTSLDPIPHITCVGHSKEEITTILQSYADAGIDNILSLRGDTPKNGIENSDFEHAADLVSFIREFPGASFGIGVAGFPEGHPETPNRLLQMEHLKAKVDCGVDWICSQLFFDNASFYDWIERCELAGITTPTFAGIMPITSIAGMRRMAELAGGANFPAKLQRRLYRFQEDADAVAKIGTSWAAEQCADLLDNQVRGIHFFTMNKSTATEDIYSSLGVSSGSKLRNSH